MLSYLGLETTRGWCRGTVLRAEPCLFGLYTVVALMYWQLPEERREGGVDWAGKAGVTSGPAHDKLARKHGIRRSRDGQHGDKSQVLERRNRPFSGPFMCAGRATGR
jgi:hypothetical protein